MKKLFFLLCFSMAIIACKEQNPITPTENNGETTPSKENASCSFTYKVDGLKVEFKNSSTGLWHYTWDVGDGHTLYDANPTWTYEISGDYKVTLKGYTKSNKEYSHTKTITVKSKTEQYIICGYKLYNIPYNNKYYLWTCEGITTEGDENFYFNTVYTPKLSSSDLPYAYKFTHPVLLEDIHSYSYYTITVQYNSYQNYESGTQSLCKKLLVSDILKKKDEYILKSDNGKTKIGILMEYR